MLWSFTGSSTRSDLMSRMVRRSMKSPTGKGVSMLMAQARLHPLSAVALESVGQEVAASLYANRDVRHRPAASRPLPGKPPPRREEPIPLPSPHVKGPAIRYHTLLVHRYSLPEPMPPMCLFVYRNHQQRLIISPRSNKSNVVLSTYMGQSRSTLINRPTVIRDPRESRRDHGTRQIVIARIARRYSLHLPPRSSPPQLSASASAAVDFQAAQSTPRHVDDTLPVDNSH